MANADRSISPPRLRGPVTRDHGTPVARPGHRWLLLLMLLVLLIAAGTGAAVAATSDHGSRSTVLVNSVQASNDTPSAADNDYTRINNAIRAAQPGMGIELEGEFDWTEPLAMASWALGSNGVAEGEVLGTGGYDWSIRLPDNLHEVTVRASANGAVINGFPGLP